jgi:hypothetical protein
MTITLQARVISVKIAQHQVLNPDFDRSGPDSYSNRRMVYADIEGMLSVSLDVPKLNDASPVSIQIPADKAADWLVGNIVEIAFTPAPASSKS